MGLASFYNEQLLPRMIDKMCGFGDMIDWRRKAVAGLHGTVLEIGFGSGLNVPVYPPEVTRVLAVEPSAVGRKLAARRIDSSTVPVEFVGLDGQSIPLDDEVADSALSTFTLCTIPDERAALREVFRVLKLGGDLHVVEHGRADDDAVVHRQQRYEPINRKLAGGCHLTRDHWSALRDAGFDLIETSTEYAKGPRTHSFFYLGVARKPAV
jgi:ubiquinone/menaquinone biosynthesis C-methylase UbiE